MTGTRGQSTKRLRQVLLVDGLTSGATGLGLATMPGRIATLIGAPSASLVIWVGVGLMLFGLGLVWNARRPIPSRGETILIATLNVAWVVASAVVLLVGGLSALGNWAVILVGIVVMGFAFLELRYLPTARGSTSSLDTARA